MHLKMLMATLLLAAACLSETRAAEPCPDGEPHKTRDKGQKGAGPLDPSAATAIGGEVVFAVRKFTGDGHWYANFGYSAANAEQKHYAKGGGLRKLNLKTGVVSTIIEDEITRFDMENFQPTEGYVREMKRYGVLPPEFEYGDPVNVYEADRKYWESLYQ